jgi:hypothetical protein
MNRLARRYLITGAIGIGAMLTALGVVLFKASDKVSRADSAVKPTVGKDVRPPAASGPSPARPTK